MIQSDKSLSVTVIENESHKFREAYLWFERAMSQHFFEEISQENLLLLTHSFMGFDLQNYFCALNLNRAAIVMCLDSPDADLKILENYRDYGIKNYLTFVSTLPPPFKGVKSNLRIGFIYFTEAEESKDTTLTPEVLSELKTEIKKRDPHITDEIFDKVIGEFNPSFLKTLSMERLILAIEMFFRAKSRDNCQYEVRKQEDWKETGKPSLQIVLAWRNTPKHNFLTRVALTIHRHGLVMKGVNATYVHPYSKDSILVMSLALHGAKGEAAWEAADLSNFLRELVTEKYFAAFDIIDKLLVSPGILSGVMGNLIRSMVSFVHQALVHVDSNLYSFENIQEGFTRDPELTKRLTEVFQFKFDPFRHDTAAYEGARELLLKDIMSIDTGNEEVDNRRKNVLFQGLNMVHFCLKTNLFRQNYTALGFRMDPAYLNDIPFNRSKKFPEIPFAIFFIKGMHYFGFHIRFRNLARGGLRTVYLERSEQLVPERNQIFTECYNLAYTQQKKNKDIPEGGAKAIIFLEPFEQLAGEVDILKREFTDSGIESSLADKKIEVYITEQKLEYLYQTQRSFIETLLTLVNCDPDGRLRARNIVDYWKKPEYLYLGPDENMHDAMIEWIADTSKKFDYKPGTAFISGKPRTGINHKEYGVTSRGLNVYVEELLKYVGIDPHSMPFTIKMAGGPDGDVAGNEILNLLAYYPHTAKLIALTDISGTIYEPNGLDLEILASFFHERKAIRFYPPEKLTEGGYLLDKEIKRQDTSLSLQTLLWRKKDGQLIKEWLSGNEMNALFKRSMHKIPADVFIPAGGRPRTLNESNILGFCDETGKPSSRIVVEGANLYTTQGAREKLEKLGVLIVKDSSANKTGVICSSFEVLCGLAIGDELFVKNKEILVKEILNRLIPVAYNEAQLLLRTHDITGLPLTQISEQISERINLYDSQINTYLENIVLSNDPSDPLNQCYLRYALTSLRTHFQNELLFNVPESHKKACIACSIAAELVYKKGLQWTPEVVDILPVVLKELNS